MVTYRDFIKKAKILASKEFIPFWILLGLSSLKFINLGTGLVLGEPDEFTHAQVARSFEQSWMHMRGKDEWFYELPGYSLLAYLVQFLVGNYYLSLRLVSVSTSVLASLGSYWLASRLFNSRKIGLVVALSYTLSPLVIFYARVGVPNSALVAFSFLFILSIGLALKEKSIGLGALSGLFLALAVLMRYSALIYVGALGLLLTVRSLCLTLGVAGWNDFVGFFRRGLGEKLSRLRVIKLAPVTFTSLLSFFVLVCPITFICWRSDPWHFKRQLFTTLESLAALWQGGGSGLTVFTYLANWSWWLSIPLGILFLIGIAPAARDVKRYLSFWLFLAITVLAGVRQRPFYPSYFLMLVPFVSVIVAYGFLLVWDMTSWYTSYAKGLKTFTPFKRGYWQLLAVLVVLLIPSSIEAWRSSQHRLVEDTAAYIRQTSGEDNPRVFTSYRPDIFAELVPTDKAVWLSVSDEETRIFLPEEERSALAILNREGGYVVLESLYSYSPLLAPPKSQTEAWDLIKREYDPQVIVEDFSPNFPYYKKAINKIGVYRIEAIL